MDGGPLRAAARIAVPLGAIASLALMFYAQRRQSSWFLRVLFTVWVASPFVILWWGGGASKRLPEPVRTAINAVGLLIVAVSLVLYGNNILNPPRAQAAFVFVVLPPASWLLIALAAIAAFINNRRRSSPPRRS